MNSDPAAAADLSPNSQLRISLCMICGNEAAIILRCLDSAAAAFDELCLVRAIGEQVPDKTVELARQWCGDHGKRFITTDYLNTVPGFPHTDSFAAARNVSIDLATGDWCMWLDCDDLLNPDACAAIRQWATQTHITTHFCRYDKTDGSTCPRERLWKRGSARCKNRVHEQFNPGPGLTESHNDTGILHAPLVYDRESSHLRNLALLRLETDTTARNLFYLHEELYWLVHQGNETNREEAIATGHAALQLFGGGGMEERYEIYLNLGELDLAGAEIWFDQALRLQPWRREALAALCQRAIHLGQRSWALSWFRMMDALPRPSPLPWTHREIWHGWARNYLRVRVLKCAGQFELAKAEHEKNLQSPVYAAAVAAHESGAKSIGVAGAPGPQSVEVPTPPSDPCSPLSVILCPTRERADRCRGMIDSFYSTRLGNTHLVCYVALDDPQLERYRELAQCSPSTEFIFGKRLSIVEVFNKCLDYGDADYYGEVNDDHIYRTPGWDLKLQAAIKAHGGWGMAYGRTQNLPSGCLVSANCVRALGWYFPPTFRHQYVDNVIRDLYSAAGLLLHVPEVWIEHCHPAFGKAELDHTYAPMMNAAAPDAAAYQKWRAEDFENDLAKLQPGILCRKG